MPLTDDKFDIRAFLHKIEATEGVDAVPTGPANAIQLIDGRVAINFDERERNIDQPKGGAKPKVYVNERALITGSIEMVGAATAGVASPYSSLIRSAGNTETLLVADAGPPEVFDAVQHSPILQNIPSASSYFYHDGEFFKVVSSRSRFLRASIPINDVPTVTQETLGKVLSITEAEVPGDVDTSAFPDPVVGTEDKQTGVFADLSILLDDVALDGVSAEWDFGVTLAMRYSTEATRSLQRVRAITGTLNIFRPEIADSDIRSMVRNHAKVPLLLDYQHTDGWRNQSWQFPRVQLGEPALDNQDGDKIWRVPFTALPTVGNDDYTWTFGKRPATV